MYLERLMFEMFIDTQVLLQKMVGFRVREAQTVINSSVGPDSYRDLYLQCESSRKLHVTKKIFLRPIHELLIEKFKDLINRD